MPLMPLSLFHTQKRARKRVKVAAIGEKGRNPQSTIHSPLTILTRGEVVTFKLGEGEAIPYFSYLSQGGEGRKKKENLKGKKKETISPFSFRRGGGGGKKESERKKGEPQITLLSYKKGRKGVTLVLENKLFPLEGNKGGKS